MNTVVPFHIWMALLCAVGGYLLGNIQTAIIVSKAYYHDDVRNHGSGNAGSTNMVRVFGLGPGTITFIGDFAKAILGVLLGRLIMGTYGGYIAGYLVIIGHCYPIFAGFRGGKGVASSCGIAFMVFPFGMLGALAVAVLLVVFTKKVSVMSLAGVLLFLVFVLIFRIQDIALVILAVLIVTIVYVRHIDNIKRLLHGEEQTLICKK
ncbi:MAG: glycerol-3-phosphate 1-O-acyltransferase PlsY [Clostridia bacterium]